METATEKKYSAFELFQIFKTNFGWWTTFEYIFKKYLVREARHLTLRPKHARYPLTARLRTSDLSVFRQIFCEREFACIDDLQNPRLIIDCGANVGYSASYFLSRYPMAFVIAVEPDTGNFDLLKRNLAPYAGRYKAINSAVWSKHTGLRISEIPQGDGKEWSVSVRETKPGETAHMQAMTINEILADSGYDRISLLKIDIEGAEKEIFTGELEPWLSKTDVLTVELHSEEYHRIFETAVASQHFTIFRSGELTVCKRS